VLFITAAPARAQEEPKPVVDVVQVSGHLDPVVVDFLEKSLDDAERRNVEAFVLQLDSPGAVTDIDHLVERIRTSTVPVAVWVGPSGAEANGEAARLVDAAAIAGMSKGSHIDGVGDEAALEQGTVDLNREQAAILGTFIASLDGREAAGRTVETANFDPRGDKPPEATLTVQTRLAKLPLGQGLMHTMASPAVAYLLLTFGLALLVFEFFTAGVGIAGGVGAVMLVFAAYGLTVLPTRPIGLALCVLGVFGFAVDVQTGVPRVWTGLGLVSYVVGSLLLFDGVRIGWLPLVAGVVGMVLMMLAGLPATVRSRFSTPTIGRHSMVGEMGEAVAAVDPDGVVKVREALWPARTNRATPIAPGGRVRVVAVDGPRLEVEPEEGGARDHRERRQRGAPSSP
jgi:membrane-bound serine protease (ClpP class)